MGATDNPDKYGNEIFKNLKIHGYEVYPVNPKIKDIDGSRCYSSLSDILFKVDVIDFVVPARVTKEILKECRDLKLNRIWLQPGAESEAATAFCHKNDLELYTMSV